MIFSKKQIEKMNKTRIFGILILLIGIILMNTINNDLSSFISGVLIGIGGAMAIAGKTFLSKKRL